MPINAFGSLRTAKFISPVFVRSQLPARMNSPTLNLDHCVDVNTMVDVGEPRHLSGGPQPAYFENYHCAFNPKSELRARSAAPSFHLSASSTTQPVCRRGKTTHFKPPKSTTIMKTKIISASMLLAVSLFGTAAETAKTKPSSPEFERMKALIGTWTGKADMGEGPVDMSVRYRLIAAGSVLEERVFEGTPNEMVTMYFDNKDGKLAATHYCMLGNRPAMKVVSSDDKSITFDFDASNTSIDPAKESHMHGMTIRFEDADTISTNCTAMTDGKQTTGHPTTLKRVK
jgi:hypothetical protein